MMKIKKKLNSFSSSVHNISPNTAEYQHEARYSRLLPYTAQLDRDTAPWLREIKTGLGQAVLNRWVVL